MKVAPDLSYNQDYLKKLDQELKHKIIQRESEIENVKKIYDKKLESEEQLGEESYLNKIDQNKSRIESANNDYITKLKDYNENLEKTKINLSQEEKSYKEAQAQQLKSLKAQGDESYKNIYENSLSQQDDLQFKTGQSLKMVDDQAHRDLMKLENKSAKDLAQMAFTYNQKSLTNENDFQSKLREDLKSHQELLTNQKDELKKSMQMTTDRNKRLEMEKVRVQQDELNYLDKYHKNLVDQKQADFKTRYEQLTKEHDRILNDIKSKLDQDIKVETAKNAQTKKSLVTKAADDFYRIDKLAPKLSDSGQEYVLTINVPEHERENVHLVAHGRDLKLTMSRKFSDTLEDEEGTINRTSKSQLFSKELKTLDLVNPKKVTENYQDGLLTFKISKL
jgi:HSP20 family molecular chaperone IbpA